MTIQIKPSFSLGLACQSCQAPLQDPKVLWQGMNVCAKAKCCKCGADLLSSLPVGHGIYYPFQIDLGKGIIRGDQLSQEWLSGPLLKSLKNPQTAQLGIKKEILKPADRVIILDCIDYLYGHCLLKLLNAQRHLEDQPDYGVIVVIQPFLKWMVPDGISEIWTVDLPLRKGQLYYPNLNEFIHRESHRFHEIKVSKAYSHPSQFDIKNFTKISRDSSNQNQPRITFIWREDRLWCNPMFEKRRTLKALRLSSAILWLQNRRIQKFFKLIRKEMSEVTFSIAGLGTKTKFPNWIEDARVEVFDVTSEQKTCQLYANSSLVIGVHGSSLLLPSGHAEMSIDLMPRDRWGNYLQDILYQEKDPRMASFRHRYLPLTVNTSLLAYIATDMISKQKKFQVKMSH